MKIALIVCLVGSLMFISQSLWLDEAAQVIESQAGVNAILANMVADFHPPLFHLILHFWMMINSSEIFLRLLPLLLTLINIVIIYLIAKENFNAKVAEFASILLAVNPFFIFYSVELRPYILASVVSSLSVLFYFRFIKNHDRVLFCLINILGIYTSYFFGFLLFAEFVNTLLFHRQKIKSQVIISIVVLFSFLPWLNTFVEQLKISQSLSNDLPGWSSAVATPAVMALPSVLLKFVVGNVYFRDGIIYLIIALIILGIWIYIGLKNRGQMAIQFAVLIGVSLIIPILYTFFQQVVSPKRLLFLLPLIFVLIGNGLANTKKLQTTFLVVLIFMSLGFLTINQTNHKYQREDWRSAVAWTDSVTDDNSLVLFKFSGPFAPYTYYTRNKSKTVRLGNPVKVDTNNLQGIGYNISRVVLFEYLSDLTDKQNLTENWLIQNGFNYAESKSFDGVGEIKLYTK